MPKGETLDAFIRREHTRLQKARDNAIQKKAEIDQDLAAINRELNAIAAYNEAKGAKPARVLKRAPRRRTKARGGEKRQAVLDVIKQHRDPRRGSEGIGA